MAKIVSNIVVQNSNIDVNAQNNFVKVINIKMSDLSSFSGSLKQKVCDYINAMPVDVKIIRDVDSKVNIVVSDE